MFSKLLIDDNNYNIVFIDGNHKKEPTIKYFIDLQAKLSSPAIIIFDDINWSLDMQKAWEIIKSNKNVTYSIDMFKFGILIFDKNSNNKKADYKLHLAY